MRKTPVLFVGPPGIGKTAITIQKYDYTEVVLLSSMVEEDISGIPYREGANECRTIPLFIQRLIQKKQEGVKNICLFFDELDKARREVADTMLSVITNPEKFRIPEDVHIVAACNPPEWGGGDGISPAMMSRFSVIMFEPNIKQWAEYILNKYQQYSEVAVDFVNLVLHGEIPLLEVHGEGYSWRLTCPRSLENCLRAFLYEKDNYRELIYGLVTAKVASRLQMLFATHESYVDEQEEHINSFQRKALKVTGKIKQPVRVPLKK